LAPGLSSTFCGPNVKEGVALAGTESTLNVVKDEGAGELLGTPKAGMGFVGVGAGGVLAGFLIASFRGVAGAAEGAEDGWEKAGIGAGTDEKTGASALFFFTVPLLLAC
jgi:hypothetical protein